MTGIPAMMMLKWMEVPTVSSFHLDYARLAPQFRLGAVDLGFTRTADRRVDQERL